MATVRDQGHPETTQATQMSKARDLINAHLYPVLATFAVIYGAIQIAPIAQQARLFNECARLQRLEVSRAEDPESPVARVRAVLMCNGGPY